MAPGIDRESTTYAAEGKYYNSDNVRFRSGNPEKIGGWVRVCDAQYVGICRTLWNWLDFKGDNYLGVGTNLKYYILSNGVYYDITPLRKTFTSPATDNCFATVAGSATVTVTIQGNGATDGDYVTFSDVQSVGGIPAASLNKEFQIKLVDGNVFTIVTDTVATSSTTGGFGWGNGAWNAGGWSGKKAGGGGTSIIAEFQVNTGQPVYTALSGWGAGAWGRGAWGSGTPVTTVGTQLGLWTNDNYGQDLALAQRNGAIYYWSNFLTLTHRAVALVDPATTQYPIDGPYVPWQTLQILTSAVQQFVVAMGANGYVPGTPHSDFDPMIVRWSDQADPFMWVPSIINQAGEYRLSHGSTIMMAQVTRQEILIWTDTALYSMQYLGTSYVWGFNILMDNISVMSPSAAITVNNATYWMGREKFYVYTGRVDSLPCTLKQYVYDDINTDQSFQVFAGLNPGFNEIWWYYCSKHSTTIDRYVVYNYVENLWFSGTMARTAWLFTGVRQHPIAADYNKRLLYHEVGCDDGSGSQLAPITAFIETADFDIEDGHNFGFVWRMLPDVSFNGSTVRNPSVTLQVKPRRNAGAPYGTADAPLVTSTQNYLPPNPPVYVIQEFTGQVYTRLRGRQMAFKINSDSLGVAWTLGATRLDLRPDGRR
jgi:hypothetical protein